MTPPDMVDAHKLTSPARYTDWLIPTVFFLLVGVFGALTALHATLDMQREEANALNRLETRVRLLSAHLEGVFLGMDTAFAGLTADILSELGPARGAVTLDTLQASMLDVSLHMRSGPLHPQVRSLFILNAQGFIRAQSGLPENLSVEQGQLLLQPFRNSFVPHVLTVLPSPGRLQPSLYYVHRIQHPHAGLLGAIVANISPLAIADRRIGTSDGDPFLLGLYDTSGVPLHTWQSNVSEQAVTDLDTIILNTRDQVAHGGLQRFATPGLLSVVYQLHSSPYLAVVAVPDDALRERIRTRTINDTLLGGSVMVLFAALGVHSLNQRRLQRKHEEQLTATTSRYSKLADYFPNGAILLFDKALSCTLAEGRGLADMGLSARQLQGARPIDALPHHAAVALEDRLRKAVEGEASSLTLVINEHVYQTYLRPIAEAEDDNSRCAVILQDITSQEAARAALHQSQVRLNEAQHLARMGSFEVEFRTGAIIWSDELYRLFGLTPGTPAPPLEEFCARFAPEAAQWIQWIIQYPSRDGLSIVDHNFPYVTAQGEHRHCRLNARILHGSDGSPEAARGTIQDITDLHNASQALARSEGNYRTLADNLPNGAVLLIDGTHAVLAAGGQALALVAPGHVPDQKQHLSSILATGFFDKLYPLVLAAEQGDMRQEELVHDTAVFAVAALPLPRDGADGPCAMLMLQDVTRQKQGEAELKAARDAAQTANTLKGQFVANISHEMRTPLSGILGIVDVALAQATDPAVQRHFTLIRDVAEGLLRVINDLLDFARMEAGKLKVECIPYTLAPTITDALAMLAMEAERKHLQLLVEIGESVPASLHGDPLRLRQILVNLVGNAIKFTESGHVRVMVTNSVTTADRRAQLHFAVQDSGPGIASEAVPRLFESFSQADGSYSRQHTGSGLGLAICRHIVDLLGGAIGLVTKEGEGSTFWFTIPYDAATATGVAAVSRISFDAPLPETQPLRVLLAEDNELNREFLTVYLEQAGHTVVTATNGIEALRIIEECFAATPRAPIDIVLMDVQMPGLNGIEACKRIRQMDTPVGGLPVIALTAHNMAGDRERFLAAGMDDFVAKPVKKAELYAAIARQTGKVARG